MGIDNSKENKDISGAKDKLEDQCKSRKSSKSEERLDNEIRQIDPQTGDVLKSIAMPHGVGISGLEADGRSRFFCGGGQSGKLRVVRRPD